MDDQGNKVIVCDNGTGFVKCGYAGTNFPSHIFPSMVGRPTLRSNVKVGNIEIKGLFIELFCPLLCVLENNLKLVSLEKCVRIHSMINIA